MNKTKSAYLLSILALFASGNGLALTTYPSSGVYTLVSNGGCAQNVVVQSSCVLQVEYYMSNLIQCQYYNYYGSYICSETGKNGGTNKLSPAPTLSNLITFTYAA